MISPLVCFKLVWSVGSSFLEGGKLDYWFRDFYFMHVFTAVNFQLIIDFAPAHTFWHVVPSISYIKKYFLISLIISFLTCWLVKSVLFNPSIVINFPNVFYWFLISCHWSLRKYFVYFQSFQTMDLSYWLAYSLSWNVPCAFYCLLYTDRC